MKIAIILINLSNKNFAFYANLRKSLRKSLSLLSKGCVQMINSSLFSFLHKTTDSFIILNKTHEIQHIEGVLKQNYSHFLHRRLDELPFIDYSLFSNTAIECYVDEITYTVQFVQLEQSSEPSVVTFKRMQHSQLMRSRLDIYEQIFDKLNDGILVSNREGKIVLYNRAQEKLENLKRNDVINKYLWDVYKINAETSEHRQVMHSQIPIIDQYKAHAYSNGEPQYVTYSTYPLLKSEKAIGAFSICMNDTMLKDLLHETLNLKRKLYNVEETEKSKSSNGTTFTFQNIKGRNTRFLDCIRDAQNIALYDTDILIVGESGTGKELFAQGIHNHSARSKSPFIAINCAAIPKNLLESTLFGTVKGAFTGSMDQAGLFEYAQNGTVFLDEINSMPLNLQAKIIRVLEERKARRVGSNETYHLKCQIISASNEDPQLLIQEKRFRLDLFYRIAKSSIFLPPLRERKDDILFYTSYFLQKNNEKFRKHIDKISPEVEHLFLTYQWPGNTRELEHLIDNMYIRSNPNEVILQKKHIPDHILVHMKTTPSKRPISEEVRPISVYTKSEIEIILEQTDWNITQAAKHFGISRQNLQYYLRKHKIERPSP